MVGFARKSGRAWQALAGCQVAVFGSQGRSDMKTVARRKDKGKGKKQKEGS
jgi:hypothetical protein